MMIQRYHEEDDSQWGLLDILFIMLLGFILMFFIAIQHMNPVAQRTFDDPKAEFLIKLTWDKASFDDVDLWVQDPTGAVVSFRDKEISLMHLDRDDLGRSSDTIILPNGQILSLELNREVVSIRGKIPGWYVVNVHMYGKHENSPTNVIVEVQRINPYKVFDSFALTLTERGQEQTIVRFKLNSQGDLLAQNRLSKKLFTGLISNDRDTP